MEDAFRRFTRIDVPETLVADGGRNPAFVIAFEADGPIPFPQVILWEDGRGHFFKGSSVRDLGGGSYQVEVPAGLFAPGEHTVQIEGCRSLPVEDAGPESWLKEFRSLRLERARTLPPRATGGAGEAKLYFGIHKHMHQPYYNTTDPKYWDGEKDGIFGSRRGPYTSFIPAAVRQYIDGGLPHAGLSTTWSGTLIEQLDRCEREDLCGGAFSRWSSQLRAIAQEKTALGHPRVDFSAFGFFHPLMPLIPERDIVKGIRWHREIIEKTFGVAASRIMFPPETAFHVRMIPALRKAGVEVVMYDSIHRFRTTRDYPYSGPKEGMLPPNPAEQENAAVDDWLQLHDIWAGSLVSPSLLKPEFVKYEDPSGAVHTIIAVPCERYIGNEDARGGFGALQYGRVLGQVLDHVQAAGTYDPEHPPFFILHSDGDNHGGGSDAYYHHNTGRMVEWLQNDPRFELTTVGDYLERFPPDAERAVHIEPGSWSGADNGDPQFMKWFSRYLDEYSPDLNSWAVLTAFQNLVHTLEDARPDAAELPRLERLLLTAETSCYWYWTGQRVWDEQVTHAANAGADALGSSIHELAAADRTPPTIFPPWLTPENPGGQTWGDGGLCAAPSVGTVHTFISDVAGVAEATLVVRSGGTEERLPMRRRGPYPSNTRARRTAEYFTRELPTGRGDVRYYIEAQDGRGNVAQGALERAFLA